jgi:hypothetical protein
MREATVWLDRIDRRAKHGGQDLVKADPVKVAIEGALEGASNPAVNIWERKPILVDTLTNAR